jgi:hypothetical protein
VILRAFVVLAVALASAASAGAQPLSPRNASYTIDVKLDTRTRTLTARETLIWTNITNASTSELQFHLYYNAWRNDESTWMREHKLTSWWDSAGARRDDDYAAIDISSLKLTGGALAAVDLTAQMR